MIFSSYESLHMQSPSFAEFKNAFGLKSGHVNTRKLQFKAPLVEVFDILQQFLITSSIERVNLTRCDFFSKTIFWPSEPVFSTFWAKRNFQKFSRGLG